VQKNLVRCCCLMCNNIKDLRPYGLFVSLFRDFLAEHGEEYRAADPDSGYWNHGFHRRTGRSHRFQGLPRAYQFFLISTPGALKSVLCSLSQYK